MFLLTILPTNFYSVLPDCRQEILMDKLSKQIFFSSLRESDLYAFCRMKLSLVIQRESTKLPEIFDLIIQVFVSTTISTSERSERVEIV
jgi:hypothetical protein